MKGRARPPSSPESEESWTVDCPCGVNYDDGDEMVDCDECGVWVHTSCCRVLKGHTSYVCDKCKFKKKKESEESEVAQLLVELPSKTPPLEEKIFTLRTELSIEERAHVQGIPGGDPSFFAGVSPVFSRQLWKYTGYVPKVFQFNYNDLPEEKVGTCVLFADLGERSLVSPVSEILKGEYQVQDAKVSNADARTFAEVQADKLCTSKDKQCKRELRKEVKHRHRLQQEDYTKNYHYSKRRRDENVKKDFTSKKRTKNYMVDEYHGTPKRSYDDMAITLKSSRAAPRNPKAYAGHNFDDSTGAVINHGSKTDEFGGEPHNLGFTSEETGVAIEGLFPKHLASKAARKDASTFNIRVDREGSNGSHRLLGPDNTSHQEAHFHHREQEGAPRSKVGDLPKTKEQFGDNGLTDGKSLLVGSSHSVPAVRLNVLAGAKDQVEQISKENVDSSPGFQEHLPTPAQQGNEGAPFHEDAILALQKQSEMVMTKQPEQSITRSIKGPDLLGNVSDDEPYFRMMDETHAENSSHFPTDQLEDQLLQAQAKHQDLVASNPSSPAQQDVNAASWVASSVGNPLLTVDDSRKSSPLSAQTGPSHSGDMSSPTLSGPGVDSKQQGFTKGDSMSPPLDRTPTNAGLSQPISSAKTSIGSPRNRAYTSVPSKGVNTSSNPPIRSNSSSKHRSRTQDMKKTDFTKISIAASEDLTEAVSFPLHKSGESKVAPGKSVTGKAALHSKAQASHILAAKHLGQPPFSLDSSFQEQSFQGKHSLRPTPTSNKRNTSVLVSSTHGTSLDPLMQGTDSTRPPMNDEELALLLHQELNSSPRVARVARVRQSGTTPHPFSSKRPATGTASTYTHKDPHLFFRRKNKDEPQGEVARGTDDACKTEVLGGSVKPECGSILQSESRKDKDRGDTQKLSSADLTRHLSPVSGAAAERGDLLGANDQDDVERRTSSDNILTLPGLIEEILNEKGNNASYDHICDEVLPHWSKLRKHNGERYAYTSHRQAVLDCLRNRSAWSHLIDRGPKTNLGRKRRRAESVVATESDNADPVSLYHDGAGDDHSSGKGPKEGEVDGSENWPLSDSNKDADLSLPEEVPKGKRKARRGRRLTTQSKGYAARAHHDRDDRTNELASGVEDDLEHMVSPLSEEAVSTSEDDDFFVHRGAGRHVSRHRGSSVDSEDDDTDS